MSEEFISNAESRGCRGQGDGKDPARLDTGAASWPLPKARAGYRDCGSHGSSSDRSPRSPRTSGDVPTWTHATDKPVPLYPRSLRGLEPKQAQNLLHRDLSANSVEVDTWHGCSSLGDVAVQCSRTVPFHYSSWGTGTTPLG